MFCTSIIPTIGRESLRGAVYSVLNQDFAHDAFEIIVVNDSGRPLPEEDWQHSSRVQVVSTQQRERCVARNVGAALARGRYLHFLDDDDWLLPGALDHFWRFSQAHGEAAWLYGGTSVFDRENRPVIDLVHQLEPNCFVQVMAGEWIPLQASLIHHACFHQVGGFNPLIPGIEDVDLARRMALHFDFHGMGNLVAGVGLGEAGSTTNQTKSRLQGRQARELILNEPGVYLRFSRSANHPTWRGRMIRIYGTSMVWNLSRGKFFTASSRFFHALAAFLRSMPRCLLRADFWNAILRSYESETFARGQSERQTKR